MQPVEQDARVRRTACSLRDAGHRVIYVGFRPERPGAGLVAREQPLDDLEHYSIRVPMVHPLSPWVRDQARGTRAWWSLRVWSAMRAMLALEPAVIHAHDLQAFRFIAHAARLSGVPLIYDSHELERGDYRPEWGRARHWLHRQSERAVIGLAARVVTVAPSIADTLAEDYRIARPLVLVNSHPRAHIRPNSPLRERLGLGPEARVVVFAGSITASRGLEQLLGLLPGLPDHVHIALLGRVQPGFEARLSELLSELGTLGARVHLLPAVPYEDVIHTLWGADVGYNGIEALSESLEHALPNKFFEYAFAGVPILTTPGVSVRELVERYQLGRLCPLEPEALRTQVMEMTAGPPASGPSASSERFTDDYCWETQERRLLGMYDELLAGAAA